WPCPWVPPVLPWPYALTLEKPANRLDASRTAPRVDAGHDLRGHELQLVHPRARNDTHEQGAVRADAFGARHRGDLGADEVRPLGDDLGLAQPFAEARPRQIAAQGFADGHRTSLVPLAPGGPLRQKRPQSLLHVVRGRE